MNGTIEHHCSEGYADGNRETAWDIGWNKNMRNRIIMGSLMEWLRGWSNQAKGENYQTRGRREIEKSSDIKDSFKQKEHHGYPKWTW